MYSKLHDRQVTALSLLQKEVHIYEQYEEAEFKDKGQFLDKLEAIHNTRARLFFKYGVDLGANYYMMALYNYRSLKLHKELNEPTEAQEDNQTHIFRP
jgi:hypothetical protein